MHPAYPFMSHEQIANLAYQYWDARGRPDGSPEIDWERAVATLARPLRGALDADVISAFDLGPTTIEARANR
jgi:Protein of unknown function (DUF2934)